MPFSYQHVLKICEVISEQEQLKVTAQQSLKGASYTFVSAFAGGLLGGPLGLAIGSAAGGVLGFLASRGTYKSVVHVLQDEMNECEKEKLVKAVRRVLRSIDSSDVTSVLTILHANKILRGKVVNVIKSVITEMGFHIL